MKCWIVQYPLGPALEWSQYAAHLTLEFALYSQQYGEYVWGVPFRVIEGRD